MLAFSVTGSRADIQRHYMLALLFGGVAIVLTGLLDIVLYHGGLSRLLDPFRTATYALLTDVEAEGAKRVVGLMPEASVYGSLCVSAAATLTFCRSLFRAGGERLAATVTIAALLVMASLSTSSTAYVGLGVFAIVYGINLLIRIARAPYRRRKELQREIFVLASVAFLAFAILALRSDLVETAWQMIDKVIFQKTSSVSFTERSAWTRVGWQAFLDTGGLGTGIGSLRTSNWAISILGSTGVFGGLLIFGFFAQKLLTSPRYYSPRYAGFMQAMRLSLIPPLVMNELGGTIPDIGIVTAATLGFLASTDMTLARAEMQNRLPPVDKSESPVANEAKSSGSLAF
jgi:hypothetical protein